MNNINNELVNTFFKDQDEDLKSLFKNLDKIKHRMVILQ